MLVLNEFIPEIGWILDFLGSFTVLFFIIWLFYPEKAEKILIMFQKLLAYISEKHEMRYISKSIEFRIKNYRKKFDEKHIFFPYDLKIEWISSDELDTYLKEGKLIIKMRNHKNQSKNFALAVRLYVPNGLIPLSRIYVDPDLMESIDYVVSKDILSTDTAALNYFINFVREKIENLQDHIRKIETIHDQGYLIDILIREFDRLKTLYPKEPSDSIYQETVQFEDIVYRLVSKQPEEKVDTKMEGQIIRAAIVPVARLKTWADFGTDAHLRFIKTCCNKGIGTFYVTAAGEFNPIIAKHVAERAIRELNFKLIHEKEYKGKYRGILSRMYLAVLHGEACENKMIELSRRGDKGDIS